MANPAETSGDALMARFRRHGTAEAFEQIVSSFLTAALGVAYEILADRCLAEDAVQEAFLRVVRQRRRYVPGKCFSSWFYAILRNVCRDMLRSRARYRRMVRDLADRAVAGAAPPRADPAAEPQLLARLPAGERAVLALRIVQDLPFRDVAAALGISEEAAKKRAQRALRRLREQVLASAACAAARAENAGLASAKPVPIPAPETY